MYKIKRFNVMAPNTKNKNDTAGLQWGPGISELRLIEWFYKVPQKFDKKKMLKTWKKIQWNERTHPTMHCLSS